MLLVGMIFLRPGETDLLLRVDLVVLEWREATDRLSQTDLEELLWSPPRVRGLLLRSPRLRVDELSDEFVLLLTAMHFGQQL